MKRSEINAAIKWSIELLDKNNFKLPRFAYWTMDEWEKNKDKIDTLREVMAGWDITDFVHAASVSDFFLYPLQ